jgi:hypothetical protein
MATTQGGVAVARGANRSSYHTLPFSISFHSRTELFNHADWLVANRETSFNRILALEDVDIRAADRCRRNAYQSI